MKKLLLFNLLLVVCVFVKAQTIDVMLDGAAFSMTSPRGNYLAGNMSDYAAYYNVATKTIKHLGGDVLDDGGCFVWDINDEGQLAVDWKMNAAIWTEEDGFELLPLPEGLTSKEKNYSAARCISNDGKYVVVSFGSPIVSIYLYTKGDDGIYTMEKMSLPEIDPIYNQIPQYIALCGMTDDGNRILCRYRVETGEFELPFVLERTSAGDWTTRWIAPDFIVNGGKTDAIYPGVEFEFDGDQLEDPEGFEAAYNEWLQKRENYYATIDAVSTGYYYAGVKGDLSGLAMSENGKYAKMNISYKENMSDENAMVSNYPAVIDLETEQVYVFTCLSDAGCLSITNDGVISMATPKGEYFQYSYISSIEDPTKAQTLTEWTKEKSWGKINLADYMTYETYDGSKVAEGATILFADGLGFMTNQYNGFSNSRYETYVVDSLKEYVLNVSTNYPSYSDVEFQDNIGCDDNQATIYAYTIYIDLRFVRWSDGSTENPRTITVTSDTTLIAEFESCYSIQVFSSDENKGTVTGGGKFSEGDTTTITATPAEGYMFDYFDVYYYDYNYGEWHLTTSTENPMHFDYINQNYQFMAHFKQSPVLIDGLYYDLTDVPEGITVRFYTWDWSQVNIWAWDENGNLFDSWPGIPMNYEGDGWWSYTFDPSIENINVLFNDGGNGSQTADIDGITENTCYEYIGNMEIPYSYYCLPNEPTATVTYAYEGEYSGAIVVPDQVVYKNKTYKVTYIEEQVFAGHPITSLSVTNNITFVYELNLFGCYDLTQLKAHADLLDNISGLSNIDIEELYVTGGYIDWLNKADYPSLKVLDLSATENYVLPYGFFKGEEYDYNYEGFAGLSKLVLPNNLNTIYNRQFRELWSLEEIVIPDGVTEIPEAAFYDCHALSKVTLSKNLTSIDNYAFYSCHALENIIIPEGVTEIGNAAFYGCSYLENIELPSTLEEVGNNAFALCSKVKSIKAKAHTPPTLWAKTFYDVDRNTPVYVAEVAYDDYVADQYWGEFFNIIATPEYDNPTGVENADETSVTIYTQGGILYVEGVEIDYNVFDASGRLIYTGRDAQLQLPRGVYVIAVGGEVQKVIL